MSSLSLDVPIAPAPSWSYRIDIEDRFSSLCGYSSKRRIYVITQENIWRLWGDLFLQQACLEPASVYMMGDGEHYKSLETFEAIQNWLLAHGANRQSLLVAFGGGVVGDMAGFVAATYMRGVDYLQVPTTLLSQVDSSVGGKTAINLADGKNMVGAFCQPRHVHINLATLSTLDKRNYAAGMAEVIKYGFAMDLELFEYLESHREELANRDKSCLAHVIYSCCAIKSRIVAQDEKENGLRAVLNFGHTIGHVIERWGDYRRYLHGEAVAMGMVAAARISAHVRGLEHVQIDRLQNLLEFFALPTSLPLPFSVVNQYIGKDKKSSDTFVRFVVVPQPGQWEFVDLPFPFALEEYIGE
ncbi:3-dehydroquinate synthase [Desulfurispira natronophila]|uniref:3-dehydroquinate synthase n=1 Tax=Desulfurispira natronophila TaxID=682562 RepID=A0A7W7Y2H2_9BACT|nr:3-dehydroquinate synthase [Desulfurispira natronophila]MBB5020863.1 3-dehydroquinate synthase [Desulfurispira natronophila]